MRRATFPTADSDQDRVGLLTDDRLHAIEPGFALLDLLGDDGERLARAGERALRDPSEVLALDAVRLRAPIPRPPSILDFYAFEQHVKTGRQRRGLEMEPDWYELPVFYFTNPAATLGPGDPVPMPPGAAQLDLELEVAAVVGGGSANLSPEAAEGHIAGYMVMNDWSARDLQRRETRLNLGPTNGTNGTNLARTA